jgi:hypothetical protein
VHGGRHASVARREIEQSDVAHARIMQGFFGLDWKDPLLHPIVPNTGGIPVETRVRTLRLLTDDPTFQETAVTRAALGDRLVEWRVRAALSEHFVGGLVGLGLEATVSSGKVTLTGTFIQFRMKIEIEKFVRVIAGVKEVENRIVIVHGWSRI